MCPTLLWEFRVTGKSKWTDMIPPLQEMIIPLEKKMMGKGMPPGQADCPGVESIASEIFPDLKPGISGTVDTGLTFVNLLCKMEIIMMPTC